MSFLHQHKTPLLIGGGLIAFYLLTREKTPAVTAAPPQPQPRPLPPPPPPPAPKVTPVGIPGMSVPFAQSTPEVQAALNMLKTSPEAQAAQQALQRSPEAATIANVLQNVQAIPGFNSPIKF